MQITFSSLPQGQESASSLVSGVQTTTNNSVVSQIAEILTQRKDIEPSSLKLRSNSDPLDIAWKALHNGVAFYNTEMLPEPHNANAHPYSSYMDFHRKKIKEGKIDSEVGSITHKLIFRFSDSKIIEELCGKNFKTTDKILEVGCGIILKKQTSQLTSHFPNELLNNVTYSDGNSYHVGIARDRDTELKQADLETLSDSFGSDSFEHIVGLSVFDTLQVECLPDVFTQAFRVLKPGGKLFILAAIQPFQNTLFTRYGADERNIVFPLMESQQCFSGVQIVTKEILEMWISEQKNKNAFPKERQFFETLLGLNKVQRELFATFLTISRGNFLFSKLVEELFGEKRTIINSWEFYENNMRQGLINAGFKIKEFGVKSGSASITNDELPIIKDFNYFFQRKPGCGESTRSYAIVPEKLVIHSKMHVIIAKKPED